MSRSSALRYYVLSRLLLAPLMLWTVITIVFLLLRVSGNPVDATLGPRAPESAKEALRIELGLDAPLWLQYVRYLGALLQLDLGTSIVNRGQTVWQIIRDYFPATVELTLLSMLVSVVVGVAIGSLAASRPNTAVDAGGRLFGIITYAVPMYWFGMVLQLIFGVWLGWFPTSLRYTPGLSPTPGFTGLYVVDSLVQGRFDQLGTALHHLALPSLTLGILLSGIFERMVRINLKQTLRSDYVEAARARGIPEYRVVLIHALRNALIPVVTVLGLTIASLLGGAILTEATFSWPGLAFRLYEAIRMRDYPVVQGIMVFFGAIVAIASIAIDILNAYIDPRIRY
ncbi:MAG: ABC transporter permease [Leptolyngbya sp. DLM2.Bin15]|nr:MAG: ABC transporter permease [Leptolyngbya sp. DLM2.Bin15]